MGRERIVILDWETFYDPKGKYSLRSKGMSTSLYVRDKRFKEHCVGIWLPEEEEFPRVYWYDDISKALKKLPWSKLTLLAHHAHFDGFVLSHHHGLVPKRYACTLSMARGWHGAHTPADLGTLMQYHGYQNKLVDIGKLMAGVQYFPPGVKRTLAGDYCRGDVMGTWLVYQDMMRQGFPPLELDQIDRTVAMFANPVLRIDRKLALAEYEREKKHKENLIEIAGVLMDDLQSAEAFAQLLRDKGVDPPTKIKVDSEGREYTTYAFAKTDLSFQKLLTDPDVADLVEARLAAKSTIGQSRARAFLDRSAKTVIVRDDGSRVHRGTAPMPIYLNYAKAHTLRRSGGDSCLAGDTKIYVWRDGVVLCIMLSALQDDDAVWDGVDFVAHDGLIDQGEREVIEYQGLIATPDHKVYIEESDQPTRLDVARREGHTLRRMVAPT